MSRCHNCNIKRRWTRTEKIIVFLLVAILSSIILSSLFLLKTGQNIQYSHGISMLPAYPYHEILICQIDPKIEDLELGDIILFKIYSGDEHLYIHHRIIEIDEEYNLLRTQGDNNFHKDPWVSMSQVLCVDKKYIAGTNLFPREEHAEYMKSLHIS